MLEYGCEIVFACRKFMFITMIFLLHGYLLQNSCVAMYYLGLNVEPLLKLNAYFILKNISYENVWLVMVGVAI